MILFDEGDCFIVALGARVCGYKTAKSVIDVKVRLHQMHPLHTENRRNASVLAEPCYGSRCGSLYMNWLGIEWVRC